MFIYLTRYMQYIGFNIDEDSLEKLKIISFITKKNRTTLLKEGIVEVIEKYSGTFDEFQKHITKLNMSKNKK